MMGVLVASSLLNIFPPLEGFFHYFLLSLLLPLLRITAHYCLGGGFFYPHNSWFYECLLAPYLYDPIPTLSI
ncbi:hypothetical protein BDV38DRAFT_196453 [Aspergillus pseudotamarii]|uniref:Uncharacterized protein n=1 Tax=Aspergillus pseudotamarii TaxID=132259 RepID=A0A5N6SIT9_ASPPS|nr:uncharacterized protein BDV38DRAFT_196453 [Aspergillus pseudotamarii]KAE8133004.1 hypothetical protein BDV38DRAFT_196453 [Aspergillus pseudotamarii]